MKLCAYILCLDAMPFLEYQIQTFKSLLGVNWHLHLIEGVADSVLDTSWVAKIQPRFSTDGTQLILNKLQANPDPRISVYRRQLWHGKVAMVNAALSTIKEECVLMQIDADEIWQPHQLEHIVKLFSGGGIDSMRFFCRFWLGPGIMATGVNCWSNRPGEWHRAWRFKPGMLAAKHEPPILQGVGPNCLSREQTKGMGLVFDHLAYYYEKQIRFKETYYKYPNLHEQWIKLQKNTDWPVKRLADYFPFVGDGVGADRFKE